MLIPHNRFIIKIRIQKTKTKNIQRCCGVISLNNPKNNLKMRKILLFTSAAAMVLLSSCSACGNNAEQGVVIEMETDSIYMSGDSAMTGMQTFIFEGTSPMNGNAVANVLLAISTVNLNSDGTFTITTDYVDEGLATQNDNGEAIIVTGNDSTLTVIELVSANMNPTISFMMQQDSSLVKVKPDGTPVSNDASHKLNLKK